MAFPRAGLDHCRQNGSDSLGSCRHMRVALVAQGVFRYRRLPALRDAPVSRPGQTRLQDTCHFCHFPAQQSNKKQLGRRNKKKSLSTFAWWTLTCCEMSSRGDTIVAWLERLLSFVKHRSPFLFYVGHSQINNKWPERQVWVMSGFCWVSSIPCSLKGCRALIPFTFTHKTE